VWYKELGDGGGRTKKADTEWFKGVWLGPNLRSTETLIGTSKGVVRAYTTERLSPSTQWDINQILDMRGTPQRPDPSKPGLNIPVKIRLEPDVQIDMPVTRPARKEEGPRDVYLSKDDFRTHGFTEGCEGCSRMAAGVAARPHTKQCRARMKEAIKSTPDGKRRLEEDERKVHEFLERKLVEEHGDKDEAERPGITGAKVKRGRGSAVKPEQSAENPPPPGHQERQSLPQHDGRHLLWKFPLPQGDKPRLRTEQADSLAAKFPMDPPLNQRAKIVRQRPPYQTKDTPPVHLLAIDGEDQGTQWVPGRY
jgi:hypothetical protein